MGSFWGQKQPSGMLLGPKTVMFWSGMVGLRHPRPGNGRVGGLFGPRNIRIMLVLVQAASSRVVGGLAIVGGDD